MKRDELDAKINEILSNKEKRDKLIDGLIASGVLDDIVCIGKPEPEEDWVVYGKYYISPSLDVLLSDSECQNQLFSRLESYNLYATLDEASRWQRKLYCMNKLRLIANHYNENWTPDWCDESDKKYFIEEDYNCQTDRSTFIIDYDKTIKHNHIYFKKYMDVIKAIKIMGEENLRCLFE